MEFQTIEQVKTILELNSNDFEGIKKELKKVITDLHPDRNGGEYKNGHEKEVYLKASEALEFVEQKENEAINQSSTDLIRISQLRSLMQMTNENLLPQKIEKKEQEFRSIISEARTESTVPYKLPRISLAVITAILSFIWIFPNQISEHPILKRWISPDDPIFAIFWFQLLLITILFWVYAYRLDEKEKSILKSLKLESTHNRIFRDFREEVLERKDKKRFSHTELYEFIQDRYNRRKRSPSLFLHQVRIDSEILNNLASLIIDKGMERKILNEIEISDFEPIYEIK
ncbi:hypothetical protein [Haliscomenobacter hydrossis]|uniref:Uncharacterized protein n=1 Tax=Haliscomenobacter hydrossis (strain ATCC 27775 / DSM 1100 / LMG 10767 / O) TaxID=760192 RepID=F4L2A3_HALH1|nr:hypothetical protein [Haliscomenobacter hydrossis]AEE52856.1 hypothetical protein Halhy_5028 [Haliscomenobacter hydrossis DSM 1100]